MKFLASHESSTRGTFDFPIELYYVDKMHPRYEMPFHWHMEFELMLVLSGEFSLLIDGRSYLLHKGDQQYFSITFCMASQFRSISAVNLNWVRARLRFWVS